MIYSDEIRNVCQGLTETDRISTMLICFHEEFLTATSMNQSGSPE